MSDHLKVAMREAVGLLQDALNDCPCCGKRGYPKDGICVMCGWGDVDHAKAVDFMRAAEPLLREIASWQREHEFTGGNARAIADALALLDGEETKRDG